MNQTASGSVRMVRCPGCGESAPFSPTNPWRPFCSERCRNGDLGAWSSESYRIAARAQEADDDLPDDAAGAVAPRH